MYLWGGFEPFRMSLCSLHPATYVKRRGSLWLCVGVKNFPEVYTTSSRSLLWRAMKRPPFFKPRTWKIEKVALQPLQILCRSWGFRPYRRKRKSQHSYAPSSMPFTVDGCTINHTPFFVNLRKRCVTWPGAPAMVSSSAFSTCMKFWFRTPPAPFS